MMIKGVFRNVPNGGRSVQGPAQPADDDAAQHQPQLRALHHPQLQQTPRGNQPPPGAGAVEV